MKIAVIGGGAGGLVAARALVRGPGIHDLCADAASVVAEVQAW